MEITNHTALKAAIAELKEKERVQKELLVEQFHYTKESLRPANILKSTFNSISNSSSTGKNNFLNAAMGVGAGLISKKLFVRSSTGFFKKIIGTALELGVAKTVAENAGGIKSAGIQLLKKLFKPKQVTKVY